MSPYATGTLARALDEFWQAFIAWTGVIGALEWMTRRLER